MLIINGRVGGRVVAFVCGRRGVSISLS
jgi:hypothetical protein